MISAEQNELMTRVGRATPCGKLLRRYWQPVALTDEMNGPRPVKAVRIMGEDLVLYKAGDGYALLQRHCPHRGADLAYGRIEPDGRPAPSPAGNSARPASATRRRPKPPPTRRAGTSSQARTRA